MSDSNEWKKARRNKAHKEAWKHFYPEGNGKAKPGYLLHHVDENLRKTDFSRYAEWNIEDLVMIENGKHTSLHNGNGKSSRLGKKHTPEAIEKMSKSHMGQKAWNKGVPMSDDAKRHLSEYWEGRCTGENHPFFGKHHTDEARLKMSEAKKGRKMPDEQKMKISESLKGIKRGAFSEEHRRKLRESRLRYLESRKSKEVANVK